MHSAHWPAGGRTVELTGLKAVKASGAVDLAILSDMNAGEANHVMTFGDCYVKLNAHEST